MAIIQKRATYATRCTRCGQMIEPGAFIWWSTLDRTARHAECPEAQNTPVGGVAGMHRNGS